MLRNRLTYILLFVLLFPLFGSITPLQAQSPSVKPFVVIDPAHGAEDTGVVGVNGKAEKDVTLAIAQALQKELAKEPNMQVILTRNSDQKLSVDERRKTIEKIKPALVLSLHVNAGFGKASSGFELYYPGFKSPSAPEKKDKSAIAASGNQHLNDTIRLAHLVQKNLAVLFPRKSRSLREAKLPLAENMPVPVLIVELGFLTNPGEAKKLTSEKTQLEIAKALAKSIKSFMRGRGV